MFCFALRKMNAVRSLNAQIVSSFSDSQRNALLGRGYKEKYDWACVRYTVQRMNPDKGQVKRKETSHLSGQSSWLEVTSSR